jgi:serine/threonine protein kinase
VGLVDDCHRSGYICFVSSSTDKLTSNALQILSDCIPFSHLENDAAIIQCISSGGHPMRDLCLEISDEIWRMLEKCWSINPDDRPSMRALTQFFESQSILQSLSQLCEEATSNLTGLVRRTGDEQLGEGGFAKVWKGELIQKDTGKPIVVIHTFIQMVAHISDIQTPQVAVKVFHGVSIATGSLVALKKV